MNISSIIWSKSQ